VHTGARGALQVEADPARIGGEEDSRCGLIVEVDDVLRAALLALVSGEVHRARAGVGQQVSNGPFGEVEHALPLTEHHHLASLGDDEARDEFTELGQLRAEQPAKRRLGGPGLGAQCRPDALEVALGEAVADDALLREDSLEDPDAEDPWLVLLALESGWEP
jgi:hypothetical protein